MPDPAAGTFEFPGGHREGEESPRQAAVREWQEETGLRFPDGEFTGTWTSADGIYQGFVYTIPHESDLNLSDRNWASNPDDPDGDLFEAIAWWDPAQLAGNPAVRPELLDSLDDVLAALGCEPVEAVEKAGDAGPKGQAGQSGDDWPGWAYNQRLIDHWAPLIADATATALTVRQARRIVADYRNSGQHGSHDSRRAAVAAVAMWLASRGVTTEQAIADLLPGLYTDAYLVGAASGLAVVNGGDPQVGYWRPGDTDTARDRLDELGAAAGLATVLAAVPDTARSISGGTLDDLARTLIDGTDADDSDDDMADALVDAAGDRGRADGSALTAIVTAIGLGAMDVYLSSGVRMGRWVTGSGNVCPRCQANADAGPVPLGEPYPSGDTNVPAHPRCACSIVADTD